MTTLDVRGFGINSNGDIFVGTSGGVFRSTDNGDNWNQINNGLPSTTVVAFGISDSDDIFAGTFGGVFSSTDNGDNWSETNTGLTDPNVTAFVIQSNGDIFAATQGGGVFRGVQPPYIGGGTFRRATDIVCAGAELPKSV